MLYTILLPGEFTRVTHAAPALNYTTTPAAGSLDYLPGTEVKVAVPTSMAAKQRGTSPNFSPNLLSVHIRFHPSNLTRGKLSQRQ